MDNQSTHQSEDTQDSVELDDKYQDMEDTLPPESQGDSEYIIEDPNNQLDIE